ncbi:6-bladed beta-propeller [Maribacter sp. 2304DJ31-5]|uniref:6-bladed beta-propeller n=1 Tax=Maribacter sp. 2304DJ31-5 TaxID=3386273 RepID=UPI0039BC9E31
MRLIYWVLLLLSIGCKNENFEKTEFKETINIGKGENVKLSRVMDSISFITLDKVKVVGDISMIKIGNDGFYIHDRIGKSIIKFDITGKYVYEIKKQGRGPGEYTMITDYLVNSEECVEIIDIGNRQRLWFNQEGNYIKETKISSMDISHLYLTDSMVVGSHHPGARLKSDYFFHLWNRDMTTLIDGNLPFEPFRDKYLNGNVYPFSKYGKTLNLCTDYSNIVYSINELGAITPKYELNFTHYKWPPIDVYKKYYNNTVFEWSDGMKSYVQFLRFIESEEKSYLGFYVEGNRYNTFYDKTKKTSICAKTFIDDIGLGTTNFEIVGFHNQFWYAIVRTYEMDNLDILNNRGVNISSDDDNPFIIIKFKLK